MAWGAKVECVFGIATTGTSLRDGISTRAQSQGCSILQSRGKDVFSAEYYRNESATHRYP
jgi:hypothetical protein